MNMNNPKLYMGLSSNFQEFGRDRSLHQFLYVGRITIINQGERNLLRVWVSDIGWRLGLPILLPHMHYNQSSF